MEINRREEDMANVERNDTEIVRETPALTDTLSLSFSSDRFMFNDTTEDDTVDCINKSGNLFADFKRKPPTLEEALKSMEYGDEKSSELCKKFMESGKDKLENIDAPGVTIDDVAVIICYTFECGKYKEFKGLENPYRKLSKSLSIDRSDTTIKKTRGFLFLLLQSLRKLPHYIPDNYVLYRGMDFHVQTEMDINFPKRLPYAAGNEKVWWAFTSTTESLEVAQRFINGSQGTLFTLSGEAWGYDISMFSDFPDEKEILLEPERKLKIMSVANKEGIISVNAKILDTPLVLEDFIKVKAVKIKLKKSKVKEVPEKLKVENVTESAVELSWTPVDPTSKRKKDEDKVSYQVSVRKTSGGGGGFRRNADEIIKTREARCTVEGLETDEEYEFRVCCGYGGGWGKWSDKVVVMPFSWKKCPSDVDKDRKYSVDKKNPRIATKKGDYWSTIIGNTPLPPNKVTSWSIKVLKSKYNNGYRIYIGVAPFDINQNEDDNKRCGWYFSCYVSALHSGPPHNYSGKVYGLRKGNGEYVHTGDIVGVVMDTAKGDLSFALNGVNLGVAFERIPLDKPLVPCVILKYPDDSVELDTSKVKENVVDSSIPVPSNITAKSTTWDSITFTWDVVEGSSSYLIEIEVDGSKSWDASSANSFTKKSLLSDTEHTFRMRVVRGNSVSEWSAVVKGRTQKESFERRWWKECPDYVNKSNKYAVDVKNTRIATFIGGNWCTIIGNTTLPLNKVTSWSIKILETKDNDGDSIYIGVAPSDIDQNEMCNFGECGWYFDCFLSTLWSGPPHNYGNKEYGPRKEWNGEYIHTGDSVGVVMDTTKGELSFVVNGVNLCVAYEGIPLDKPLVPCVLLCYEGDSVELII